MLTCRLPVLLKKVKETEFLQQTLIFQPTNIFAVRFFSQQISLQSDFLANTYLCSSIFQPTYLCSPMFQPTHIFAVGFFSQHIFVSDFLANISLQSDFLANISLQSDFLANTYLWLWYVRSKNQCSKYQMFTPSGCEDIGIRVCGKISVSLFKFRTKTK